MKTTLFLSVSIDGFIADENGVPYFPEGAWEDWCSLVNKAGNVIAGRSSCEQLIDDPIGELLTPEHKVVVSSKNVNLKGWEVANSAKEALNLLENKGVEQAFVGGGRAVAHSFMRDNLIDFIILDFQPVAFGKGVPIFGDIIPLKQLKLLESKSVRDNVLRLRYEVVNNQN